MVGIKDFDMPSCCGECQMASCKGLSGQFYCDITTYDVDMDDTERDADCPLVEAISKDQYEQRLKADMVAMLEDLDLQIDESAAYNLEVAKIQRLIRDKIDKLKEIKE